MAQELLHKFIYSLISGFTEFFPVSAPAHQLLYQIVTGRDPDAGLTLAIHIGCLVAVLICCKNHMKRLSREKRLAMRSRGKRSRQPDAAAIMDTRLLRTAGIPIVLSVLLYRKADQWIATPLLLAAMLVINGVILFIPRLVSQGNKDGRSMSPLDGLLMGLGGALAVFPGVSRVGAVSCGGTARGAERSYILDLAFLLSIPALIAMIVFDIYAVVIAKAAISVIIVIGYILAAIASFGSACLSIMLMRYLIVKADSSGFAYYSWGVALFSFIIYLVVR